MRVIILKNPSIRQFDNHIDRLATRLKKVEDHDVTVTTNANQALDAQPDVIIVITPLPDGFMNKIDSYTQLVVINLMAHSAAEMLRNLSF